MTFFVLHCWAIVLLSWQDAFLSDDYVSGSVPFFFLTLGSNRSRDDDSAFPPTNWPSYFGFAISCIYEDLSGARGAFDAWLDSSS
jgi:hypothetical protein